MTTITVHLELPDWVRDGIANGSLKRIGGVIRNVDGKSVVRAMLREAIGSGEDGGKSILSQGERMLEGLGASGQVIGALQVANLAVSAAGFALVLRRLGELDEKLDDLADRIKSISKDVQWTRDLLDRDLLARVRSAARKLALDIFLDPAGSRAVLSDLIDTAEAIEGRRDLLFDSGLAYADAELFAIYSEHLETCIRLQLGVAWRIGPASQAALLARDWARRLADAAERLKAPIRAGITDTTMMKRYITLNDAQRSASGANLRALLSLSTGIEEQAALIEAYESAGVTAYDLEKLDAAHPGSLMLICPVDPTGVPTTSDDGEKSPGASA